MINTIVTAFISFASTNIDDIFILMLFFSKPSNVMKRRNIIIGQYLGVGLLVLISIIGALGMSVIPQEYVGLLGLVPIYLGIKEYIDYKKDNENEKNVKNENTQVVENSGLEEVADIQENRRMNFIKSFINPSIIKVAAVTFANGGDNIGIYIPLFAKMDLKDILITVVMFALFTALWCFMGLKLSEYPLIEKSINKYKHIFIPIVFIALGIFILSESSTINIWCLPLNINILTL